MPSPDDLSHQPRELLLAKRASLEKERTRSFLIAQTTLFVIGGGIALSANFLGYASPLIVIQSVVFTVIMGAITGLGWYLFRIRHATVPVVVGLLYIDSVVALFFFYIAGEFEVALGILTFTLVMAPIYAGKRHVWGIAVVESVMFLGLIVCRQYDLIPYGPLLPIEAVTDPHFVVEQVGAFLVVTFGIAFLAGQASIDILTSQRQLEDAVTQQTQRLAEANTELARAGQQLRQTNITLAEHATDLGNANSELAAGNAALEQFNAAISHDLRSPLQTAMGNMELLLVTEPDLTDRGKRRVAELAGATERMAAMIRELHQLSQVSAELGDLRPVELDNVVRAALQDLDASIKRAEVLIEVVSPLPIARGNASLLKQVFQNLLENAIKYGEEEHPKIRVTCSPSPDGIAGVAVEDNGDGIAPEDQQRVFQMFCRLNRHAGKDGIGAGLAIVERIVLAHGGRVRVERSEALGGARFTVELPMDAPKEA
jgi:signal transduction histidine kinase